MTRKGKQTMSFKHYKRLIPFTGWPKLVETCEQRKPDDSLSICKHQEHPYAKQKELASKGYIPCCIELCPKITFCQKCGRRCVWQLGIKTGRKLCPTCQAKERFTRTKEKGE